ncbi:type 1 pili subunit FimI [Pseudomonas monteilii]|uniref:Type 1 pili subunit FimI n=1 Tax=Pseudomonas monteilii TaxID=76759 RepID=A0AAP7FRU1_9PSED|nr:MULTISPECIES: fimbrial protein [Pseudomonas]KPM66359.1 type 1 pili subunit FimI [Pseudomonas putida]AYN15118.1 type 1 pili subunit FimI [Pseudomonas monteilii]AYO01271.1 type 1 fimbrial protein [Pseudomonas sp. LTGT-11-2Z]MBA1317122.1 fimbrial protein [Pseudomonas monteilii]MBA6092757.1 fimbrial protein [Pseudomonas monteilii]
MKKALLALALGITSSTTFAATVGTGAIHFYGRIDSSTCPIEIIDPITGNPESGNRILMGNVDASQFTAAGSEAAARSFGMRITPGGGCTVSPNDVANLTFTGAFGGAGTSGALYALEAGGAQNLALVLKDDTGTPIANGSTSKDYPLDPTKPTTMLFSAAYKSTAAGVTAGPANTSVQFVVDIP